MKRVIALILVLCFIGCALMACGNNKGKQTGSSSSSTSTSPTKNTNKYGEEEVLGDYWEDVKFEGQALNVLVRDDYKVSREWEQEDPNDIDGFGVAIDARNQAVEGDLQLDVRVTFEGGATAGEFGEEIMSIVRSDVEEQMNAYDIVACYGYLALQSQHRDVWANLLDQDLFPYFDFSLKCWNQALVENSAVNGKMYLCAGDFNISMYDSSMILWHNKDLYEELLVKTGDKESPKDIQDTVISGNWTYAQLYRWAAYSETRDIDDNTRNVYGLYMQGEMNPPQPFDVFPFAWDLQLMKKNEQTGTFEYNFIGNTKANEAMENLRKLYSEKGTVTETQVRPTFPSGLVLFYGDVIWFNESSNIARREMKDRFSILPWPKYDEEQTFYASTSQDYFTTMAVIDHSNSPIPTKGEEISAYLQYATEYSYTNVRLFYFKEIVEQKFFGQFADGTTKKSIAIFNTIIDSLQYDFATIYAHSLGTPLMTCWRYNVLLERATGNKELGTISVSEKFANNRATYEKNLVNLYQWFGVTVS